MSKPAIPKRPPLINTDYSIELQLKAKYLTTTNIDTNRLNNKVKNTFSQLIIYNKQETIDGFVINITNHVDESIGEYKDAEVINYILYMVLEELKNFDHIKSVYSYDYNTQNYQEGTSLVAANVLSIIFNFINSSRQKVSCYLGASKEQEIEYDNKVIRFTIYTSREGLDTPLNLVNSLNKYLSLIPKLGKA